MSGSPCAKPFFGIMTTFVPPAAVWLAVLFFLRVELRPTLTLIA
jgi:hypothetical protein